MMRVIHTQSLVVILEGVIGYNSSIFGPGTPREVDVLTDGNLRERVLRPKGLAVAEGIASNPAPNRCKILIEPGLLRSGTIAQQATCPTEIGLLPL